MKIKTRKKKKAEEVIAYCVSCGRKKGILKSVMKNPKLVTTKNGRKMMKGTCKVCGTGMCKFVKG